MEIELSTLIAQFDQAVKEGNAYIAYQHVSEIRRRVGDSPDIMVTQGNVLLALGRVDEATTLAHQVIAIDPDHGETLKLLGRLHLRKAQGLAAMTPLPGCAYAKFLLPLDYPPSRRLTQRWGNGLPAHAGLAAMFAKNQKHYEERILEMRTLTPWLAKIRPDFSQETAPEPGWIGAPLNALDLALLYYFVWKHRPATYLEIGSGSTTCFARRAVSDHCLSTRIISIDPEPRSSIDRICDHVVRDGLETLADLTIFAELEPGDIVFLDGSHRCFMNSDVTVFFLEVMPLLKPGVIVHIHDIVLPFDYPEWAKHWYWNEQYILATYLLGMGDRVDVLMPAAYVGDTDGVKDCLHPPLLPAVGEGGIWKSGGSFWFTHR